MRDRCIKTYVTDEDWEQIKLSAEETGLSVSEYMRRCGCKQRITSRLDQKGLKALLKVNADLARLGNLFKFAMTEFADVTGKNADQLINTAYENAHKLLEAKKLLFEKIRQIKT